MQTQLAYLADVSNVPQVKTAVAVDARHLVIRLVVGQCHRVRVFGVGRMRGHVTGKAMQQQQTILDNDNNST